MYFLFEVCESADILSVIYLFKIILSLVVSIILPIGLIIMLIVTFVKAMVAPDANNMDKIAKTAIKRVIFACAVYFVPTIVNVVMGLIDIESGFAVCYENANKTFIASRVAYENVQAEIEQKELEELLKKQNEELAKQEYQNKIDKETVSSNVSGVTGSVDTSNKSQPVSTTGIVRIKTDDLAVPLYYSDHSTVFSSLAVNSAVADKMHNILYNISVYVKSNSDMIPRLETAGAYVNKSGYHGRGLAIDLFNNWSFTKNGKTYRPYSQYSYSAWTNYQNFICEVCNGKEDCKYNINYVIYERFFKGNGWCWGGNWGPQHYDPMHYELSDNGCSTSNKLKISC